MSSSVPWWRSLRFLAVGPGLILSLAVGCGHKENPQPPPQRIPQPITDLVVAQRGDELRFEFGYPQTTISGLPIDDIAAIELWEFEMAVPDMAPPVDEEEGGEAGGEGEPVDAPEDDRAEPGDPADVDDDESTGGEPGVADREPLAAAAEAEEPEAAGDDDAPAGDEGEGEGEGEAGGDDAGKGEAAPAASKESLLEVDPREFTVAARRRLRLEGEELTRAISGDRVKLSVTLERIPDEKIGLVYGVRSFQRLDRASNFSNLFKIVPRPTPDPPAELEVQPVANGVKLTWTFEGAEPEEFRFYRRDALSPTFDRHFGTQTGDGDQFLDSTAEFGKSYTYAMSVVVHRTPLVESAFTPEREIEYRDVFPPEPPTDLVVLSEAGTARLLWQGSSDRDVAGYVVYRRNGAGEFERLNERPVREAEYSDTEAASGRTYAYRVVAVDRKGNMSDPSEEVEVRIP